MTNAYPSQTELYGELRTNEQQYRTDLASIEKLTREQEAALVERIRMGDIQARNELITHLLPFVSCAARKYASIYTFDYLDLVQDASLLLLERLDLALTKTNSVAYLLSTVCYEIRHQCFETAHEEKQETSLDVPIDDGSEMLVHELIAEETTAPEPLRSPHDYHPLYQAIDALPPRQRAIILRRHGIHEHAPESFNEIGHDLGVSEAHIYYQGRKAYGALYFALSSTYPHYVKDNMPPMGLTSYTVPRYTETHITSEQQQRLDEAYASLRAGGQKVTVEALARAAHIDIRCACLYMRERRKEQGSASERQRLDEAYASLRTGGQKVTVEALARAAHIDSLAAALYLKQRKGTLEKVS